jgi:hypothetical protein
MGRTAVKLLIDKMNGSNIERTEYIPYVVTPNRKNGIQK